MLPFRGLDYWKDEEREALGRGYRDGWSRLRLPAAEDPELERWPSVSSSLTCHVYRGKGNPAAPSLSSVFFLL
jgi:hypothetical protein